LFKETEWRGIKFMLMFAVLARERGRLFRLLLLPFLFCFVTAHGSVASAASLNVKIRQLNPAGEAHQVTCVERKKCVLPIDIQTGTTKETLTVDISFVPGNVLFKFQTPKGYLYAGAKNPADKEHAIYETIWTGGKARSTPSISEVSLFLPVVPNAMLAPISNTVQQPVADLEITTEETP
jgi:hypothetical protein